MSRPLVGVYSTAEKADSYVSLPAVFTAPIRSDIVHEVHTRLAKNKRQPYAVSKYAGHQTSAESWGTGRAVARIPRVSGGGTSRSGQGAFGNMCRGGRMFAPTKIWRRWHRKSNHSERRFAVASAVAATALPALVIARGHRVERVPEIPLVLDNKAVDSLDKTKKAIATLKTLNAFDDVERVKETRKVRPGKGKYRNRRYVQKRGPLVVYGEKGPLVKALRNIPGVETTSVHPLNLLQLAPGGHLGRFLIWTKDAFLALDTVFGTYKKASQEKGGYMLPRGIIANADINRIISSDEIQSAVRDKKGNVRDYQRKRNPLKNFALLTKLNPYASVLRRREILSQQKDKKAAVVDAKRTGAKDTKAAPVKKVKKSNNKKFHTALLKN
jgi:large subunit ribosomal protein L4e